MTTIIIISVLAVLVFGTLIAAMSRYKRCPADKILVIFGKVGKGLTSKCVHGGAAFIWPLIQNFKFLELTPMTIDIDLQNALSKQNIRVNVPSRFTIGISTEPDIMATAAERLLSMSTDQIEENARDIIFGQLRATIATMDIEEINADRERFEEQVMNNVETELKKIGLKLINVNITDITDESGYIEALGKKAAAEAINQAKIEVAQQDKIGAVGSAEADKEQRIKVADADAKAVSGENTAKVEIANSNASRREAEAEASKKAVSAEKTKEAEALKDAYVAEQRAEEQRKKRDQITQEINVVVPADVERQKIEKEADAEKAKRTKEGEGKGAAIEKEMEGQAAGNLAILAKKAEGLKLIVDAAGGNPDKAAMLLIVEQLPAIVTAQAKAISGVQFDKVVVMDTGSDNGATTTANWLSGLTKVLPGLHEMASMAGVQLPSALGESLVDPMKPPKTNAGEGEDKGATEPPEAE